jgi:BMFP domain-containing protein YqiC
VLTKRLKNKPHVLNSVNSAGGKFCYTAERRKQTSSQPSRSYKMLNQNIFDELSAKLNEAVNSGPAKDIEKNMRALLMQGFAKLNLVTREEFDVQAQVLARTRELLTALEGRVAELEAQRNKTTP